MMLSWISRCCLFVGIVNMMLWVGLCLAELPYSGYAGDVMATSFLGFLAFGVWSYLEEE